MRFSDFGLLNIHNSIYAVNQGPKGGDYLALVSEGSNFGWPTFSLGTSYSGSSYKINDGLSGIKNGLITFMPSIAVSDLIQCPKILRERYSPLDCILISTLREKSILIALLNPVDHTVTSIEKIYIGERIREFYVDFNKDIFVSLDGVGTFKLNISTLNWPDIPTLLLTYHFA